MINNSGINLSNSNNNGNISIQIRDRNDFIEEFQRQRGYQNSSFLTLSSPSINGGRWNYLHDLNKLYLSKLEEKREQQKQIEDEKEMEECTFEPKLNKGILYKNLTLNNDNKTNSSILNLDLIERQDAWNEKRKLKTKELAQLTQDQDMKQCFFTPEINNENALQKTKINHKTISLLEDPESYSMYIKRLQKKRDEDEKEKQREKLRPGSGNIWKKKIDRRENKSYDYQKHEYSRNLSRSKSIKNKKINVSENYDNFLKTDDKNLGRNSTHGRKKINFEEIDKNKLYENMYKKNVKKLDNLFGKSNLESDKNENIGDVSRYTEEESIYHEPIEYGKAIDLLHNALYSINLEQDSGEEEEE